VEDAPDQLTEGLHLFDFGAAWLVDMKPEMKELTQI
jgi:hypothetical protein